MIQVRQKKKNNSFNIFSVLTNIFAFKISTKLQMKAAEKTHAAKHRSRNSHSLRHYLWTSSSLFLIFSWMFMLVYPPLSHVSYFTTRQSPSDLPEHSPLPPPPPQLPLRSTISSLPNQIHFSPSPGTSFHFINLSHLKLNESPAWFLLFFFIPACSFYNSPPLPDSPHLH